jgi:SAM-dependent methyltransferase
VLSSSLHLLPPRARPLWLFGDDAEVSAALELLRERGFAAVEPHPAMAPGAAPSRSVDSPWVAGEARVRLWEPTPFLAEVLSHEHGPKGGIAADLACGSGRDTTYLALAGFRAVGFELLPDALAKAHALAEAARRAAPDLAGPGWVRADLERDLPLGPGSLDLAVCVRFLWRASLAGLAAALRPGASLIYVTFTTAQLRHGKPTRPEHLLDPGELRARFEALGLETVRYREEDPEHGPALACLWAVRPDRH